MARPVQFPEANFTWKGWPADDDEIEVEDLPAYRTKYGLTISCWELSPEEIAEVARTGKVWINVYAKTHPPVSVGGHLPFDREGGRNGTAE